MQTLFKRAEGLYSLCVISCIRQLVAQELDKINILYVRKFCRYTSGVGVLEQTCCLASIESMLVYIREACKYKIRNLNGGYDAYLLNSTIGC